MSQEKVGVAIIGCGTVGGATAKVITDDIAFINKRSGLYLELTAVVDRDVAALTRQGLDESLFEPEFQKVLENDEIKIVVELVGGLTIAKQFMEKALKAGKHVVTANKALLAHYGKELFALARENNAAIGFEASCGGGIPIIKALTDGLLANRIDAFFGIVNGTCNYILTEMTEKGQSYKEALSAAQKGGLAEADPTLDVNGMDSAHKLAIMSSLSYSEHVNLDDLSVEGIDKLDIQDIKMGQELGYIVKLIAAARKTDKGLDLSVSPSFISTDHPLARVSGAFNAVSVYGHAVGHTMYYGRGAGGSPTASAVVADILALALGITQNAFNSLTCWPDQTPDAQLIDRKDSVNRYYLRFKTDDKPGVVAHISKLLGDKGISISSMIQKETEEPVSVVIITHEAREGDILDVLEEVEKLNEIRETPIYIKIAEEHQETIA
ncbi:MAG: homoserine dehydrogenase [Spirochaetales bacterium]|nr:homoserine dehydrogenase [Spirochaetales bacterium]